MKTDNELNLNNPQLVAVWPGMGAVAISAGYYLMAKLGMRMLEEMPATEYFDLDHVDVNRGLILTSRLPRSRLFLWNDPSEKGDLIVFVGEAQPPSNRNAFCMKLIEHTQAIGVKRVFTFAAMATQMHPEHPSRVFGASIDGETLSEFDKLGVEPLYEGKISGLNGAFLGLAAESGLAGGFLLGEMPHMFPNVRFPKASLSVLRVFSQLTGITLDFSELESQSEKIETAMAKTLGELEDRMEEKKAPDSISGISQSMPEVVDEEGGLGEEERDRIETLFEAAQKDRSCAYELKQELDRLDLFHEYEDRFLDLFKDPEAER